jgi:hypothetical protein
MPRGHFFVHSHAFSLHLSHNFAGLLVLKVIKLISVLPPALLLFFLPLLLLLHDDLIADYLLHNDVVEDAPQQFILHLIQIK